jgi:transposase
MEKKGKKIKLSAMEIEALSQRLHEKSLCDKDYEDLQGMVEVIVTLNESLLQKDVSIKRLLKRIFGIKTEKRKKLFKDNPENIGESSPTDDTGNRKEEGTPSDATRSDDSPSVTEDEKAPENITAGDDEPATPVGKGHGRNGVDAFTGANRVRIEDADLKPGQKCPLLCPNGRLYPFKSGITLSFSGNAPLTATLYETDKLRCSACGAVFTAKIAEDTISGSRHYDASAKAAIPVYKYGFGMPFYRISRIQEMVGVPLAPSTLWDKTEELADIIQPIYRELIRQAAQARLFHNDDTTMPILSLLKENEGKTDKERTGMFTTAIVAILDDDTHIALFFTGRSHAGENLDLLQACRDPEKGIPIQMCDASSRNTNDLLARYLSYCLSHGRRRFVDILPIFPDECKMVIDLLAGVYENDAVAKDKNMSHEERLVYHQEHSGPLMKTLHEWMSTQIYGKLVEPNSVLGSAISYLLDRWEAFTLFLRVAGAPLDNNICEQALKRAVLNRKNAMFYKNEIGALIGDMFTSIIHTCYLGKINAMDYLIKLQEYEADMKNDPEKWMPWNYRQTIEQIEGLTITL